MAIIASIQFYSVRRFYDPKTVHFPKWIMNTQNKKMSLHAGAAKSSLYLFMCYIFVARIINPFSSRIDFVDVDHART